MKRIVTGEWVTAAESTMIELPSGVPGAFETVLLRDRAPVFWSEHWARFQLGCVAEQIAFGLSADELRTAAMNLADANGVTTGVLRWAVWREPKGQTEWTIEVTPPRPHMHKAELTAMWGPTLPDVAAGEERRFKHLRRAAWLVALRAARGAGFDEALLCDQQGRVVEACGSNVFVVRGDKIETPRLPVGPLPGVMRQQVLAFAAGAGIRIDEGDLNASDVAEASEIWLTNSLIGVKPVARIADRVLLLHRPMLEQFRRKWTEAHGWDPVIVVGPGGLS